MRSIFIFLRKPLAFAARKVVGTLTQVSTRAPVVALTFDDAPHPEYTPRLLDILEKYKKSNPTSLWARWPRSILIL